MKKYLYILSALLLMVLLGIGYYSYRVNHPYLSIQLGGGSSGEDHYIGHISISYSTYHNLPLPKELDKNLLELSMWNNEIVTELMMSGEYMEPFYVKAYAEVEDGKTIFTYKGSVTTKDGVTKDYLEEKVFDYVFLPEEELLQ